MTTNTKTKAKVPMDKIWERTATAVSGYLGTFVYENAHERENLIEALRYAGDYFVANPEHWIQNSYQEDHKVCSMGLLIKEYRTQAGIYLVPPPAIPERPILAGMIIDINDTAGMTPARLLKVYYALANALIDAWECTNSTDAERIVLGDLRRRATKAGFKKNKALANA